MPAEKGAFDVAWYDGGKGGIRILRCDAENKKLGEVTPAFIEEAKALLGAMRMPTDKSYVVGYSKDNTHGDQAFEYWISRFDPTGKEIFSKRIFGDVKSDVLNAKGKPGGAGTARIVYSPQSELIGFYLCHTMKWPDGVRHQGGYVGFLRPGGEQLMNGNKHMGDGWYFSHNFDQRLIYANGFYYTLAHGDAYPRALGFAKWTDKGGKKLVNTTFHTIPGESGDNTTHCQTGGLLAMPNNTFPVIFATSNERDSHDICIKLLNGAGAIAKERWLTTYTSGQYGAYPRIAHYGKDILVAWEETGGQRGGTTLQLMLLNASLNTVVGKTAVEDLHLSPYYDLTNLDDGSVVWAVPTGGSNIRIGRIDRPKEVKARLIKSMAARRTRVRTRTPKSGVLATIDGKVIAKLSTLSGESKLPTFGMRLSITKNPVRLAKADAAGVLTFAVGRSQAKRKYADLTLKDRAMLALAVFKQEPENVTLAGVAGFYYDCAGEPGSARNCYEKAGKDVAAKFAGYFE
jgi:hypothetical protein